MVPFPVSCGDFGRALSLKRVFVVVGVVVRVGVGVVVVRGDLLVSAGCILDLELDGGNSDFEGRSFPHQG